MDTARKKTAKKKAAPKKAAVKKTATRKATAGKTAARKAPVKRAVAGGAAAVTAQPVQDTAGAAAEKDLRSLAVDIDRQMKMLAEMNTRVIIAKDQLADFQEMIAEKIKTFQQRHAADLSAGHKDILTRVRETRDEAAKMFKDSKALHETYETLTSHFEKGRAAAAKEMKKAEAAFMEKFRVVEAKMLKKAEAIKKNLKG